MNTIKFALAAALVVAAGTTSFAGGLDGHDPQFVGSQALTNSYVASVSGNENVGDRQNDAYQTPGNATLGMTDAERINVLHNETKESFR